MPVVIISRYATNILPLNIIQLSPRSGMAPLIRVVLSKLIGDEQAKEIEIVANEADVKEDGSWAIKYRHPSR